MRVIKKILTIISLILSLSAKAQETKSWGSHLVEVYDSAGKTGSNRGIYDLQLFKRNDSVILYGQQFGTSLRVYVSLDYVMSVDKNIETADILYSYSGGDIRSKFPVVVFIMFTKDGYAKSIGVGDSRNMLKFILDPPESNL